MSGNDLTHTAKFSSLVDASIGMYEYGWLTVVGKKQKKTVVGRGTLAQSQDWMLGLTVRRQRIRPGYYSNKKVLI